MGKEKPSAPELADEQIAAVMFCEGLVPRADGRIVGLYPYWYGWAIMEAFQAGAAWERERQPPAKRPRRPGRDRGDA